jgi:hypothetical protein
MLVSSVNYQENFNAVMLYDNVEAVTLKLKPAWWPYLEMFEKDFCHYCKLRAIEYVLVLETGIGGNKHYHGIMGFPFGYVRSNFLKWFNRHYGFFHKSEVTDPEGWRRYVFKDVPREVVYLFDPIYDPETWKGLKDVSLELLI